MKEEINAELLQREFIKTHNIGEIIDGLRIVSPAKTIRSTRKGSEERKIVALLARYYKRARTLEWRIEKRKNHWTEWAMSTHELYTDAKEMLK